ncbi:hypothetical protein [Falsirhodobacter halotolerans]|uniref:hypothetical protein n=1 Tax=Falsirhodobacter halotolerans TaxID=1146892 RepID=UPI001FD2274A|nr:hypothetical protein [Falsirhodobacter halotolerans]MCJ8139540.1 hypothetical protein [Falsirhodobacter halotolerans]
MTTTAILIRSNGDAERLGYVMERIGRQNVADVYVVLDCTNDGATKREAITNLLPDANVIDLTKEFIVSSGLHFFNRCTWQCGDYFYYAAYAQQPGYKFYWLIDDDVAFNVDTEAFLKESEQIDTDLFGYEVGHRKANWGWHKTMCAQYPDEVYGMLYPISRLSRNAVEFLFKARTFYDSGVEAKVYETSKQLIPLHANDEAFTATTLKNNGFSTQSLYKEFRSQFLGFFSTGLPILYEELSHAHTRNKIIHPVRSTSYARNKYIEIYKRSGTKHILRRAEEITGSCGPEIWAECFDMTVEDLRAKARENEK